MNNEKLELINVINRLKEPKVLVIGDFAIDEMYGLCTKAFDETEMVYRSTLLERLIREREEKEKNFYRSINDGTVAPSELSSDEIATVFPSKNDIIDVYKRIRNEIAEMEKGKGGNTGDGGHYALWGSFDETRILSTAATPDWVKAEYDTVASDSFLVAGRGEMHLSILIETMRREGYEFQVSTPKVLYKTIDGVVCEPVERLVVDIPSESVGAVISSMGTRKGELSHMSNVGDRTRLEFLVPSRGLFGYRSEFLTDTRGEGIITSVFDSYQPKKGDIPTRATGSLIAYETGETTSYGIFNSQDSGPMFVDPSQMVYAGQIVGECNRVNDIVVNEMLCQRTAEKLGISVPQSFIIKPEPEKPEQVLFASKRFDRFISDSSKTVEGIKVPFRLHQEDFAQAMGVLASAKYESDPSQQFLKKMFNIIKNNSMNPLEDQLFLWDRIVFNYLIGNTDCHIKNFSLIYSADLKTVRLAPCYDTICTTIYNGTTNNMAFNIGGKYDIQKINKDDFEKTALECGLGVSIAMKHFDEMQYNFKDALSSAASDLNAGNLAQSIIAQK